MSLQSPSPAPGGAGLDHLLQPTLSAASTARPLYSVRANFFVAFFGGLYAAVFFSALNSLRLRRLPRDLWLYLLAVAAWTAAIVWATPLLLSNSLPASLDVAGDPKRSFRYLGRAAGLVLFGLVYLQHRKPLKAQTLVGVDPPNPWPMGLLALAVGIAVQVAVAFLAVHFRQG